ncbi:MAG: bifunctional ADP-dependent NAD(P)H-hydrate dehydratase/NAD(P)H-hydrate epimerase [SAR86 cluster bacterium]|uniref:Bifunctional NAD(P)H-hydrate repair enzyme n=1 Tax=SAR86 cluster bacterium TaxID=2030880 RepID=A0A2A4MJ63_9GAMM|nr:MAG: bifunctional ADP-dependent NAD(P)H-hydrate dehydratase/NAD(P)H-hydrate epimerase [SAR86 cluster bacterium]
MTDFRKRLPRPLYLAAQVRELDRIAIEDCGIAGFELMHKAAAIALQALVERWPQTRHLLVLVGSGHNGGDGYILAAMATQQGLNAKIFELSHKSQRSADVILACEFAQQAQVQCQQFDAQQMSDTLHHCQPHTIIVDGILGTGLSRVLTGNYKEAVDCVNRSGLPVLAIDIPTGLCSDSGSVLGVAVRAQLTVSFIAMKQGLLTAAAVDYTGEILYHSLDVPERVFNSDNSPKPHSYRVDINQCSELFRPRKNSAYKRNFGHVVVVGGDYGFGGAAIMAAEAALRSGSGLVSLITRSSHVSAALSRRPELMVLGTETQDFNAVETLLKQASVIVLGPGLGQSSWSKSLFQAVLAVQSATQVALLIDADGLNLLAQAGIIPSLSRRHNWILTPHTGEAARLLNISTEAIGNNRFAAVSQLQQQWGGCVVLKGAGSLICYSQQAEQKIELCSQGNAGMATAGMGDVLSGIVAAFVAQGMPAFEGLRAGVCVHAESADLVSEQQGQRGMVATDLFPYISQLINPIGND